MHGKTQGEKEGVGLDTFLQCSAAEQAQRYKDACTVWLALANCIQLADSQRLVQTAASLVRATLVTAQKK